MPSIELAGRVDVARHGDVDDEQWPTLAAAHQRGQFVGLDHERRGAGRRDQQVDAGERGGQLGEPNRCAVDTRRELDGVFPRAVGDGDRRDARIMQRTNEPFAHLARAEHQHRDAVERTQPLARHRDGGLRHRGDVAADRRLGAGPLAGLDRVTEQRREHRAGGVFVLARLPRPPHLTEHFVFAHDRRVETGGHTEEMANRLLVVVRVEVVGEEFGRLVGDGREELAHVLIRAVELFDVGVDLGAVARRQDDGFGHVGAIDEVGQRLRQARIVDAHPFE